MLSEILKEIIQAKATASMEVDPIKDEKTFRGKLGDKNRAKETLEELFVIYKNELKEKLLLIIATGNGCNKFGKLCEENKWAFNYDVMEFYKELVRGVDPTFYMGRPFSPNTCDEINRHIEDKADECDIVQFSMLLYKDEYAKQINSEDDLVNHLINLFNDQVGVEFMIYDILNKMAMKGIDAGFDGTTMPVMPVVIKAGVNIELIRDMAKHFPAFNDKIFFVNTGVGAPKEITDRSFATCNKVDKASIIEVLKKINEKIH